MAVFVDDMRAPFGRMVMWHMISDDPTDCELHAMADKIGVSRRWHQKAGTHHSHYDIALSKRAQAVAAGAIETDRYGVKQILDVKRAAIAAGRSFPATSTSATSTLETHHA